MIGSLFGPIAGFLSTLGGLVVFAGAYFVHQKVRMTRTACVFAMLGGFMVVASALGPWLSRYAEAIGILAFVGVFVGICVIIADVKGKRKGADRPALFSFFLVPIFFVAFLVAAPAALQQAGDGLQKVSSSVPTQTGR